MAKKIFVTFGLFLSLVFCAISQSYSLNDKTPSEVWITGKSTLHDWNVSTSGPQNLPLSVSTNEDGGLTLEGFNFTLNVDEFDGGRGASMNEKIRNAFNSKAHPQVVFSQSASTTVTLDAQNAFTTNVTGTLDMAGQSKTINVQVTGKIENGQLSMNGQQALKMSEFSMEPPSAMFGQIKTADEVVVHFKLHYIEN